LAQLAKLVQPEELITKAGGIAPAGSLYFSRLGGVGDFDCLPTYCNSTNLVLFASLVTKKFHGEMNRLPAGGFGHMRMQKESRQTEDDAGSLSEPARRRPLRCWSISAR
jgi:hypothetical protein